MTGYCFLEYAGISWVRLDEYDKKVEENKQLKNKINNLEKSVLRLAEANAKLIAENTKLKEGCQIQKIASGAYTLEKQNNELKDKFSRIYDILEGR